MADINNPGLTPDDFEMLGKEFPPEIDDIEEEKIIEPDTLYNEDDANAPDEFGRDASQRRTGQFIVPDEDDTADGGWTLPTRAHGGWERAVEKPFEEQLEEVSDDETEEDEN